MTDCTSEKAQSVHLTDFSKVNEAWINLELETSMELAQRICSSVHAMRKANRAKVRQPLAKVILTVTNFKVNNAITPIIDIIKNEVNVKEVNVFLDSGHSPYIKRKIKPNFKSLGKKFGKRLPQVVEIINGMNADQMTLGLLSSENGYSELPDEESFEQMNPIVLRLEDVEISIENVEGWISESLENVLVSVDFTITPALKQEGIARDFVNRIQNLRKDSGFDVTDKISIKLVDSNPEVTEGVKVFTDFISQEVQAVSLEIVSELTDGQEIEFEELVLVVKVVVV